MTSNLRKNSNANKVALRKALRLQRKALQKPVLSLASKALLQQALQYRPLWQAKRVASYAAFGGEIDPIFIENELRASLYLPRIHNTRLGQMRFHPHSKQYKQRNAFGMLEPLSTQRAIDPRHLDVVLMPLVAFQRDGSRLGQGGGFYDRAFAFRNDSRRIKRPLLIGLAHHFQETQGLEREPWDVAVDVIITDKEIIIV